jgi:hypothetical protein
MPDQEHYRGGDLRQLLTEHEQVRALLAALGGPKHGTREGVELMDTLIHSHGDEQPWRS